MGKLRSGDFYAISGAPAVIPNALPGPADLAPSPEPLWVGAPG